MAETRRTGQRHSAAEKRAQVVEMRRQRASFGEIGCALGISKQRAWSIYADDGDRSLLCHMDYERNKTHGYPEAHLQVEGASDALGPWRMADRTRARALRDLHFPVGGRRYRPALEDVIEFLVVEKLATPRDGWQKLLNESRGEFRRRQLRAAIRRDMETATQAVREFAQD